MTLYEKNAQRTLKAVHMEPVDKIPFSFSGCAYVSRRQGVKIADFISDFPLALQTTIDFLKEHPGVDSIHSPIFDPRALITLWYSRVKIPGVDLPDDELWQVDEQELMKYEDYQKIIDMGFEAWQQDYFVNRMGDPLADIGKYFAYMPTVIQRLTDEAGVPVLNGGFGGSPIETFCGSRQLMNFFMDMAMEPELVKEAMDACFAYQFQAFKNQLAAKPFAAWVGGWRAAPELMGHDYFMEFVWPYLVQMVDATIEAGVVPVLHFDSCWESELETLKQLPAKKCILMTDGTTDLRKAREILDDRMCFLGDVPATMQAFGTPDECYNYVTSLIRDVGSKTGLIVSSGCDVPLNAKDENVDAMIQATLDYSV